MPESVHRLQLRFDLEDPNRRDYPVVTVLVDGRDVLAEARGGNFIGFDPEEVLSADAPLLPTREPRRVAVYRCRCGEPGCGVAAPVLREQNERIGWTDFRDYTGVFLGPTVDEPDGDEILGGGRPLDLPDMWFDAAQ